MSDFTDESTDSSGSSGVSPKVPTLPPLKRMQSEKEGQAGVQSASSPNKTTQEGGSLFPKPLSTHWTRKVSVLSSPSLVSSVLPFLSAFILCCLLLQCPH